MLEKDIIKVKLPDSYRVICIADIHGNLTAFKRLLLKINYDKEKDYLFILGDILERGKEDEVPTMDYLYHLSKNDKAYVIKGNHDRRMDYIQSESFQDLSDWINSYPGNIFTQWAKIIGTDEITKENYKNVISVIKQKYQDKIDFVTNLPLVIETEEFICVHSALDSREDWWETSKWNAWIGDINEPNKTGKWIISGHTPVMFFPRTNSSFLPIIRHDNKTVSIDGGGCVFGGQLNAFIIEKPSENRDIIFSYDWADKYPQSTILETIKNEYINAVIYYGEKNIEVLQKGEYFTECKVTETGAIGLIKNEYIEGKGNIFKYWDTMFSFISVYENEIVSVIDNSCKGYTYIRNSKCELGWVSEEYINMVDT